MGNTRLKSQCNICSHSPNDYNQDQNINSNVEKIRNLTLCLWIWKVQTICTIVWHFPVER